MTTNFILSEAPSFSSLIYYKKSNTCIFIGQDLLFSARLYANLKRHLSVIPFGIGEKEYQFPGKLFSTDKLLALARYREVYTFVFSSELFLFCDVDFVTSFGEFLREFSQVHRSLKIVFCKIDYPAPSITHFFDDSFIDLIRSGYDGLHTLNNTFLALIADVQHLVLNFSSYIPSSGNLLQHNFLLSPANISRSLEVLNCCFPRDLVFYSCDDLSKLLIDYIYTEGSLSVHNSRFASSLASFSSAVINQSNIRSKLASLSAASNITNDSLSKELAAPAIFSSFPQSYCSLDIVYRNQPVSTTHFSETLIASTRLKLGAELANSIPTDVKRNLDFICPVPETGKYYAQGLARALALPYIETLIKAKDIGRSFDIQNTSARRDFIQNKLAVIPDLLDGMNVGFVDEAIFTGSTLKIVSEILAKTKINSVYFFIPTPECTQRCPFNMQPDRTMLSEYTRLEALPSYFDVNGVFFQDQSSFESIIFSDHGSLCSLCFSSF